MIVDYLQLMRSDDSRANRVEQVSQFSRGLKILARELGCPVLALSQLSRAPEQRGDNKRPILSDLRESGAIEQDADLVFFIYRDDYYKGDESEEPGIAELIIAKHRNGPIGTVKLAFINHFPKFADPAREDRAPAVEQPPGEGPPMGDGSENGSAATTSTTSPKRPRGVRPHEPGHLPGELPARRLRRHRLDPRPRGRRPALRVQGAHGRQGANARRRVGHPRQVPGRLVRPPARHPDRRRRSSPLSGSSATTSRPTSPSGRGLWLYGGPGTGKTTLAMVGSRIALEAGLSVAIYSMPKLLARIRRTYDGDAGQQGYMEFFGRLTGVDLLHIDDLGTENRTEWVTEQLYSIVNERYEARKSLVVTTNKNEAELEQEIGERVVSRLVEMCELVPVFGDDRRWQKGPGGGLDEGPPAARAYGDASGGILGPLD